MDVAELSRWTRFAAKGGIGKCTAVQDCVAKHSDDLMFLNVRRSSLLSGLLITTQDIQGDEIVVLMQLTGQKDAYLVCTRFIPQIGHLQCSCGTGLL